ncbi:MAG: hypothetical protein JWM59_1170 [Verrucomicrobiales bacterium]|nr:hypothetical protein [Verrucomicrobiales bacterium]
MSETMHQPDLFFPATVVPTTRTDGGFLVIPGRPVPVDEELTLVQVARQVCSLGELRSPARRHSGPDAILRGRRGGKHMMRGIVRNSPQSSRGNGASRRGMIYEGGMPNDRPTRSQPTPAHDCGVEALRFAAETPSPESLQRRSDLTRCALLLGVLTALALICAGHG